MKTNELLEISNQLNQKNSDEILELSAEIITLVNQKQVRASDLSY